MFGRGLAQRRRWSILIAVLTALVVVCGVAGGAGAATLRTVRLGRAPIVPAGARVVAPLSSSFALEATVFLNPSDPAALASYATAVSTPGNPLYHQYLSVAQFASRFAPAAAQAEAVRQTLQQQGLAAGQVSANGLAFQVRGDAGTFAKALGTQFDQYRLTSGRVAYANTTAPLLPASIAATVQGIVGLSNLVLPHSQLAKPLANAFSEARERPHIVTGGPQPCAAATAVNAPTGGSPGALTADELATAYGFPTLYHEGDFGAGQTIAMYELENDAASDIAAYQACYGTSDSVSYVNVDGGDGAGSNSDPGSGEASLDIENAISAAPQAPILVYQAPNSGNGGIDEWNAIISQDKATIVSTSWGSCEPDLAGTGEPQAENTLFQEAATQGQAIIDAAGDAGSEDCSQGQPTNPSKQELAVDDPGSNPYVTAVGGTSLSSVGPPPVESVWNDGPSGGGGGGGISTVWPMPAYQSGAPAGLNVINTNSSGTPCGAATGSYCREVPDVTMDADPQTGFVQYQAGAWGVIGGTSGAAPLFAAFLALTQASSACDKQNLGFVNPALYAIAGTGAYAANFNDITSGNNDYISAHGGLYPAGPGYDMASGLGSPIGGTLYTSLCADLPGAPTISSVTPADFQASVAFGGPASTGGSAVIGYKVTATDVTNPARGGQTATGSSSPITVAGLTAGDTYTFTVTATNGTSTGAPSAPSAPVTPTSTTTCVVTATITGPPKQQQVTVQSPVGLASIPSAGLLINNGTVSAPGFTAGTTSPVVVTATKTNQSQLTVWSFLAIDSSGNQTYCH